MSETAQQRSRIMRAVKSRDTKPEMAVRRLLHRMGYRYRIHRSDLPGKPDIVFAGRRKVIFVHGCFWHGHDCPRGARTPASNTAYWTAKIARNIERDHETVVQLANAKWATLIVWECGLRDQTALADRLKAFLG
ncbi:MAG: hypothetical protein VR78_10155 [Hoeflea sp. BRH_c9]|nr:MAG: hypothetical protein VR78_10155 [Hoeflea sp. BRH_c9]